MFEAIEFPRLAIRPMGCELAGSGGAILGVLVENPRPDGVGILLPPRPGVAWVVLEPRGRLGRATSAFSPAWDGKTPRRVRVAFRWTEFRVSRSTESPAIDGCRLFTVLLEESVCTVLDAGTPDRDVVAAERLNMDETSAVPVVP